MRHYHVTYLVYCGEKHTFSHHDESFLLRCAARLRAWLMKGRANVFNVRMTYE